VHLDLRDLSIAAETSGAGTARPARLRGAPPDALSHPDSHRRPRLLTGSTARLAAVGSRAPAGRALLPAVTAGRDLHPNPEGSALFRLLLDYRVNCNRVKV